MLIPSAAIQHNSPHPSQGLEPGGPQGHPLLPHRGNRAPSGTSPRCHELLLSLGLRDLPTHPLTASEVVLHQATVAFVVTFPLI